MIREVQVYLGTKGLVPGMWTLIEEKLLTSTATTLTFSGLNGDADGIYYAYMEIRHDNTGGGGGFAPSLLFKPNGLTTNLSSNYMQQSGGGAVSSTNAASTAIVGHFGGAPAAGLGRYIGSFQMAATRASNKRIIDSSGTGSLSTGTGAFSQYAAAFWNDTSTNLTSIELTSPTGAAVFDVGTRIRLYKIN